MRWAMRSLTAKSCAETSITVGLEHASNPPKAVKLTPTLYCILVYTPP